jgi:hypothetical protein
MAENLFRVELGFQDDNISYLSGSGAPGSGDLEAAAAVGSRYSDIDNGNTYSKITSGSGTNKWLQEATIQDIVNIQSGVSWRNPGAVRDNTYTTIALAVIAANLSDKIDNVNLVSGERILFTGLTTGVNNVYIVGGITGAWTFTQENHAPTNGEVINILYGTSAGQTWRFNGIIWELFNQGDSNELQYIRDFIGKGGAGVEATNYGTPVIVNNTDSLETAIGELDSFIGAAPTGGTYVSNSVTVNANISALDTAVSNVVGNIYHHQSTNITNATTVDSVLVDTVQVAKWFVVVFSQANPGNKIAVEVYGLHDGTASDDATTTDYTTYAKLKVGSTITGLKFNVVIAGTGVSQTMGLTVQSTGAVTATVTRLKV